MIEISLSWYECRLAGMVGLDRHVQAMRRSRKATHGIKVAEVEKLALHVEGACSELAYAKAVNVHWAATIDEFKKADVGDWVQVRSAVDHGRRLIVRTDDKDSHVFALVTGTMPDYKVWGELVGRDAKRDEWREAPDGRPVAWFVPKSALRQPGFYLENDLSVLGVG